MVDCQYNKVQIEMCFQMFVLFVKEKHHISGTRYVKVCKRLIFFCLKMLHSAVLDVIKFFVKLLLFREQGKLSKTKCTRLKPLTVAVLEKLLKAKMTKRL